MPRPVATLFFIGFASLRLFEASFAQQSAHPSEPPGERSFLLGEKLSGDWGGLRSSLGKSGITLDLTYSQEFLGVSAGGLHRGGEYDGLFELDLHLDLAALTADRWKGASLHASSFAIIGESVSARQVGNEGNVSNINYRNSVRLYEVWLEQEFVANAFSVRFGQLAADVEFFTTQTGAVFFNSDFGALPTASFNVTPPIFAAAAPGIRLRVNPTKSLYFQGAIYDGNPAPDAFGDPTPGFRPGTQYNDHGIRVNLNDKEGALFLFEAGLSLFAPSSSGAAASQNGRTAADAPSASRGLPGTYKVGGFYHTDTFTDFRTGNGVRGDWGWYALVDQMVWRAEEKRGLYFYGRLGGAQSDRSVLDYSFDCGFNLLGVLPKRDTDVFGVGFAYNHYSRDFSSAGVIAKEPGRDYESVMEVTYRAQLTPCISLQPDLQYVSHPAGQTEVKNAVVLGIRSAITF